MSEILPNWRNSSPRPAGGVRGLLLRRVGATPASGGPGRAGGVPSGGAGGAAGAQGEAASRLCSGSGPAAGPQSPAAAHHAEGEALKHTLAEDRERQIDR